MKLIKDEKYWTEKLFKSVDTRNIDLFREAIKKGADVNATRGERKVTPLLQALYEYDNDTILEQVKTFITRGADLDTGKNYRHKPLSVALESGLERNKTEVVKALLLGGVDVNQITLNKDTGAFFDKIIEEIKKEKDKKAEEKSIKGLKESLANDPNNENIDVLNVVLQEHYNTLPVEVEAKEQQAEKQERYSKMTSPSNQSIRSSRKKGSIKAKQIGLKGLKKIINGKFRKK